MKNSSQNSNKSKKINSPKTLQSFFSPSFLPYFVSTFILTLPLLISAFSANIANLINSILTGHYNHVDLAAVSYGFLMTMSIGSIAQGGIGALLPVQQDAIKNKDFNQMSISFYTLLIYLIVSTSMFLLFYFATYFLDVTQYYQSTIRSYLIPMFIFLFALQILSYFINTLIIVGKIKIMALFGLIATILDVIVSSIFVHGVGFIPQFGAQGAALGSMAGSVIVVCLVMGYLYQSNELFLPIFKVKKVKLKEVFSSFKLSFPAGLNSLVSWLILFVVTLSLTFLSQSELNIAANQVLLVFSALLLVFSKVSVGIIVKCLNMVEKQNIKSVIFQNILGYQLGYFVLLFIIYLMFDPLVSLFGVNAQVIQIVHSLKWFLFVYVLISSVDMIFNAFFVSQQENAVNFKSQLISLIVIAIAAILMFYFNTIQLSTLWLLLVAEKCLLVVIKYYLYAKKIPVK